MTKTSWTMQVLLCLTTLAIVGCATPISSDGMRVRQIQADASSPCKFVGVVDVTGGFFYSSMPEAQRDMLAKLRNETARLGGNAYAVTTIVADRGFSQPFAQADAYKCPLQPISG